MASCDLKIYIRTEELLNRMYPRLKNFPKGEKFALSQDIRLTFFAMLGAIRQADSVRSKRVEYAQKAEGHLGLLKTEIKLANNQRYISNGFYKVIDLELTEIGKMLSGYIRSASKRK